ncbi:NACHT%2C LRR and PYD domains-containing protein 12-like isoform X1 [Xyrichtys novacula]|uniref:NACHT, LRR and PYD domains-containing protein 12-like isoform X1 n=1 Tax=Xyrichtys novacula TaxID=13765 RepID=A0AAV1EYZ3_XYRNO|nr:NACHT%2C LRR and PYD domains-containing protein 12-like isoform X1 [Xyrichtys novacula]
MLQSVLPQTKRDSETVEELREYLRNFHAGNIPRERLRSENLSDDCLDVLLSVLQSSDSHLRELRLLYLGITDIPLPHMILDVVGDPVCKLQTLRLPGATLDFGHCHILACILQSKQSSLRALDLANCVYSYQQDESEYYSGKLEEKENYEEFEDELTLLTFIPAGLIGPVCKLEKFSMSGCRLTDKCCQVFASVLSSNSQLRELDLSQNNLQDSGVCLLSAGLGSSNCRLEKLRLSHCGITEEGCASLASALRTNPSHLRELDLSYNHPGEAGVQLLSERLEDPECKLEKLKLSHCGITEEGCAFLASALRTNPSHLRELDLSYNHPGEAGVQLLSERLEDPECKLEKLNMSGCRLTDKCCQVFASVLSSNSQLRELDLSQNNLQDSGVCLLSAGLASSNCRLEKLRLSHCGITEEGCASLASALRTNPSHLRELDLSYNHPGEAGVQLLSERLEDPECKLEKLNMSGCRLTDKCCQVFASVLSSNSQLRELDLSQNNLQDSGVCLLSAGLGSSNCRLEKLRLSHCGITEEGCASLASALRTNPSHLRELDLSYNHPGEAGVQLLSERLEDPECKLEKLKLSHCGITEEGCASLASALRTNPSHLRELDLSYNHPGEAGVQLLSERLEDPECKLEKLNMSGCRLTDKCCQVFASVLSSNSQLRELDLSQNNLQDSGVCLLSAGLGSSNCRLEKLRLSHCGITEEGCAFLASALRTNPSHLRELDLSYNHPGEAGVQLLSERLEDPECKLEKLNVDFNEEFWTNPQLLNKCKLSMNVYSSQLCKISKPKVKLFLVSHLDVCDLTLDPNTMSKYLLLSESEKKVTSTYNEQPYPDHPERFDEVSLVMFMFYCQGVFECSLTKLVFKVTKKGEVTYKTLIWDEKLLEQAHKVPAGPLYSIECPEDSIRQLHLPHCEPEPGLLSEGLSVIHITDDGMSVIQPLEITDTHVVVDVPHLSIFGLIKNFFTGPVLGQVLLFLERAYRGMRPLCVILLPKTVPLPEVKAQYEDCKYIRVTSDCRLLRNRKYSLHSDPEGYTIQPPTAEFFENYGPNYHMTFKVTLTTGTEEVTLMVQNPDNTQVWEQHLDPPALSSSASQEENESRMSSNAPAEKKLKRARTQFIDRVSDPVLNQLLDELLESEVINDEEGEAARDEPRVKKARVVIDMVRRKGTEASQKMIDIFSSRDPGLCRELSLT